MPALRPLEDLVAAGVGEFAKGDEEGIDRGPDAGDGETDEREVEDHHRNRGVRFANVEAMHAKDAEEDGEQQCEQTLFVTDVLLCIFGIVGHGVYSLGKWRLTTQAPSRRCPALFMWYSPGPGRYWLCGWEIFGHGVIIMGWRDGNNERGMAREPKTKQATASSPWRPVLRHADQATVAVLVAAALAGMGLYWIVVGGPRGELVEIDRAEPLVARFRVDINEAAWPELAEVPGIGETLARRIVDSRLKGGEFADHQDLLRVNGIGPRTLERMKPFLLPMPGRNEVAGEPVETFPVH
jgi:competence protein ComEA